MKNKILILSLLFFCINKMSTSAVIQNSYFSILSTNGNNYEFLIVSTLSGVFSSQCADMYIHPSSISADTIYLRGFYDISGTASTMFCNAYDTINFQNVYPNANVINISTGVLWEDPNNPGVYDSIWSIKDSNFNINPLSINAQSIKNTKSDFTFYPNPTNGRLRIHGRINDLCNPIIIYDMTGRVVSTYVISELSPTIDVSNLYSGLYMVNVGSKKKILKVLKE